MKKKVLPLAVSAAAAVTMSAAHAAMYVNEKGHGESLIFPFYSAENGNNTLINIVNTVDADYDANGVDQDSGAWKAVKVRIIEAQNSQEVLDFNLYLSPKDHFSFGIKATEEGGAALYTGDNSCTVPAITGDVPFVNYEYAGDGTAANPGDKRSQAEVDKWIADNKSTAEAATKAGIIAYDNTGLDRTQVGYIEVIEMGQIDPEAAGAPVWNELREAATATAANDGKPISVTRSITHNADGVPEDCSLVNEAWSKIAGEPGKWLADSGPQALNTAGTEFETNWLGGGLYGYATVINVAQGAAFGYDAIAIEDANATGGGSAMHYAPGNIKPNFADPSITTEAIVANGGTATTHEFGNNYDDAGVAQLQALNATIMASTVMNDYVTDASIAATTDWVLTFPTKAYHVNAAVPITPFSTKWDGYFAACEASNMTSVDREESAPPVFTPGDTPPIFSPAPPSTPTVTPSDNLPLCYETTIVQFGEESAAGSSSVAVGVNARLDAADGWATISMLPWDLFAGGTELGDCSTDGTTVDEIDPCLREIDSDTATLVGLPVVGFAAQKYTNGQLGSGVLANYAMSTEHKTTTVIS